MIRHALWIAAALAAAGCNSFIGVEDVTLARDGGGDGDGDAAVDAVIDAPAGMRIGNDIEFGGQTDVLANFDLARRVELPATNVTGFGVITKAAGGAGGQLRVGLYENNTSDEPANFVARSGVISDFPLGEVVAEISPVAVPAGSYWIAVAFNADTPIGADGAMQVDSCFAMRSSFANSIPTSGFDVPTCNSAEELNLFVIVEN